MPITPQTVALISAGANLAGQGLNAYSQARMNRMQLRFSKSMYDLQRKHALEDWQRQAAYDSPQQQMERLKAAGLNPHLVYGSGANAVMNQQPRSAQVEAWNPSPPQFDLGSIAGQYQQTMLQQQQLSNMEKQATLLDVEKGVKESEIYKNLSTADKAKSDTQLGKWQLDYKNKTFQLMVEKLQADLAKTKADTKFTLDENDRKALLSKPTFNLMVQELENLIMKKKQMEAETAKTWTERKKIQEAEIPYIKQQIINLKSANTMQEIENILGHLGVFRHDPVGARMAALAAAKLNGKETPMDYRGRRSAAEAGRRSAYTGKRLY